MVQQALLGLFLEHTPCQHHEMHPHDTLPLPLHYPKPNSIPNSHAETPIVWLNQLEICVDACANYDTASGIWVRAAKGVKNDICIESGDVSTEDDELLPEASGRDGAKSLVTCWIGLAKRPGNYCSRAISDPRSENEILDFKASSDPQYISQAIVRYMFCRPYISKPANLTNSPPYQNQTNSFPRRQA